MLYRVLASFIVFILASTSLNAQVKQGVNPLDDRGGLMIPKDPEGLRLVSLELWLKFQRTNQRLYTYVRHAAEFRAYLHVCKRHDLNVNMGPINALSARNLQQVIIAHYEEPEFAVLEALDKAAQANLMTDIAGDIYAFEFGQKISEQQTAIAASDKTNQSFCKTVADDHFGKYVGLLTTAKNTLGAVSR